MTTTHDYAQRFSADGCSQPMQRQVPPHSAMAVAGLVLGIIGLLTSFLPIVNNLSFVLGILGLVFAAVGLAGCLRGRRSGKAMAIAALVLNILTVVVVLTSQAAMSAAIDEAQQTLEGASAVSSTASDGAASQSADQSAAATTDLPVGAQVTLSNGLAITVDSVTRGLQNYDGSSVTEVRVTYRNDGAQDVSFNAFDWKVQDTQGVVDSETFFTGGTDDLQSGTLVPGGAVSGAVYFDGDAVKVLYYSSMFADNAAATWVVA